MNPELISGSSTEPNHNTKSLTELRVNAIQLLMSLKLNFSKSKLTQDNYHEEQCPLLNQFLDPGKKCLTSHRIQITNGTNSYLVPNSSHHIFFKNSIFK